jgi:diguanylate cyclase (GGDEF)-like protein
MTERVHGEQPDVALVAWLTQSDRDLPDPIRAILLGRLAASPIAVAMTAFCSFGISLIALAMERNPIYLLFVLAESMLLVARLWVLRLLAEAKRAGRPLPVQASVITSLVWCLMLGAMAFTAMMGLQPALQVIVAASVMGVSSGIATRNFPAPRLAITLLLTAIVPFVLGAALSGDPWLAVLVLLAPPFVLGSLELTYSCHRLLVITLTAELASQHQAQQDQLTGILNRRGLEAEVAVLRQRGLHRFTVLSADLDGFKGVNDAFGHPAGDQVLQTVALRLRDALPSGALVARTGGDEFVMVLPEADSAAAVALANRLIAAVASAPCRIDGQHDVSIGLSIGLAEADGATDPEMVLRRADSALYGAKAAGKGTCRAAQLPVTEAPALVPAQDQLSLPLPV